MLGMTEFYWILQLRYASLRMTRLIYNSFFGSAMHAPPTIPTYNLLSLAPCLMFLMSVSSMVAASSSRK